MQTGAGNGGLGIAAAAGVDADAKVLFADRIADPRLAEVDSEGAEVNAFAIAPSHAASQFRPDLFDGAQREFAAGEPAAIGAASHKRSSGA